MNHLDLPEEPEPIVIPRPPIVPKAYRPTQPARPNPDWVESENSMYCLQHNIYWQLDLNRAGCSGCAEARDTNAMRGTDSHASPDMRPKLVEENNHMQEVRVTDPLTGGQKGSKPERFDLLPWDALEEVARVYAYGAEKYADHNWARGIKYSLNVAALVRHVAKFVQGEDKDPESRLHHLAHAVFHCCTLMAFQLRGRGTDDRWKP